MVCKAAKFAVFFACPLVEVATPTANIDLGFVG